MNKIKITAKKVACDIKEPLLINNDDKRKEFPQEGLFIYVPPNINTSLSILQIDNKIYNKIYVLVDHDSYLNLLEEKISKNKSSYQYHFIINKNSKLVIDKFYQVNHYQELIKIDLKGLNSQLDYRFRTVTNYPAQYVLNINHQAKQTKSYINNRAITFGKAKLSFTINSHVKKGMKDSILNQINKIMMLNDNENIICPNLLIDEYSVTAKHGASIGKFNQEQLFYLQARGISKLDSYYLLMVGFLAYDNQNYKKDMKEKRNKIIKDMLLKVTKADLI